MHVYDYTVWPAFRQEYDCVHWSTHADIQKHIQWKHKLSQTAWLDWIYSKQDSLVSIFMCFISLQIITDNGEMGASYKDLTSGKHQTNRNTVDRTDLQAYAREHTNWQHGIHNLMMIIMRPNKVSFFKTNIVPSLNRPTILMLLKLLLLSKTHVVLLLTKYCHSVK